MLISLGVFFFFGVLLVCLDGGFLGGVLFGGVWLVVVLWWLVVGLGLFVLFFVCLCGCVVVFVFVLVCLVWCVWCVFFVLVGGFFLFLVLVWLWVV
ncbi:hypothetical protein ACTHTW_10945, partial [Neisseria sp. P0018.S006]